MATRELKATVFYEAGELTYSFPFDYIKKSFVKVKYLSEIEADVIDNAPMLSYGTDYTIEDRKVLLKEAPIDGKYICIYRVTPTETIVNFSNSSFLTEENLDLSALQQMHLNEEISDYILLHKVPNNTLTLIKTAIEVTNENAYKTEQNANEASNSKEYAKRYAQEAALYNEEARSVATKLNYLINGLDLANIIKTISNFRLVEKYLIVPIVNFVIKNTLYIEATIYNSKIDNTKTLIIRLKGV